MELANIHVWDRVLASETMDDDDAISSFHERISELSLPIGKSRSEYVSYFDAIVEGLTDDMKNQWNLIRYLSVFELLALSACPAIFLHHVWMQCLVENADGGLPHKYVYLLSDRSLLLLLRSEFGQKLLSAASNMAPGSALLAGLEALRTSSIAPQKLPCLTSKWLTPISTPSVATEASD